METTSAFEGLACSACGTTVEATAQARRCPDCGGTVRATYDLDGLEISPEDFADSRYDGIARYDAILPFSEQSLVTMDEGTTPLVECPDLAARLGVGRVLIKDEGRNPTGCEADRQLALAVTAATAAGASDVGLATTGTDGQAAAAYAARAGLDSHVFVPSRAQFVAKAMINVHGGDMTVVEGRFDDARDAFTEQQSAAEASWYPVGAFETPYRLEGTKTLAYEISEQLDWTAPDAIVCPTGSGSTLTGLHRGVRECATLGLTDETPRLFASQAAGCAPIVDAWNDGAISTATWEHPDTICGDVEIAEPPGGADALDALKSTDGGAVAVEDEAILSAAVDVARTAGLELGATAGLPVRATAHLAEAGELGADDTVVIVNTVAGNRENDLLRSYLMGQGE
jgi:threonine synthase